MWRCVPLDWSLSCKELIRIWFLPGRAVFLRLRGQVCNLSSAARAVFMPRSGIKRQAWRHALYPRILRKLVLKTRRPKTNTKNAQRPSATEKMQPNAYFTAPPPPWLPMAYFPWPGEQRITASLPSSRRSALIPGKSAEVTQQQGFLHYTPEQCLVNGGFPLFWWKKQHVSNGQNVSFKEP